MLHFWQFALVGLAGGSAYALLALGVVAVYRGSGILNFSQGAIGMIAGYVFWESYSGGNGSLPIVPAVILGVLCGGVLGTTFYVVVIQFLRNASDMTKVVATLGLLLLLESLAARYFGTQVKLVPPLTGAGKLNLLGGLITDDTLVLLLITLALAVVLSLLFHRTRFGMKAMALRENPTAASAIGITPHPTGIVTWGLGGAIAAVAGIFLIPVIGLTPDALTLLVIPAMAAGLVGQFSAIWTTVGVGLALGVVESVMGGAWGVNPGIVSSLPFAVIVIAVVAGGTALPGRGESLIKALPRVSSGQIKPVKALFLVGAGVVIPLVLSPTWSTAIINSAIFGLLALSMVVVTGYAGQISLAAAALAGFGSFIAAHLSSDWNLPFLACIVLGTLAAVILGVIVGAPAVRVRGINLAIVTLGLSLAVEDMILTQPSLTGGLEGLTVHKPSVFGFNLSPAAYPDRFAILCVGALTLGALAVLNVRRGVSGRRYLAVRANERGAASVGVSVPGAKLGAFAISAALAGLSGALATFEFQVADFSSYDVFQSITALAFTVVGGIGFVAGAIFASVSSAGGLVANFFSNVVHLNTINDWLIILSGLFVIQIMIQFPDGAVVGIARQVDFVIGFARGRHAPPIAPRVTHSEGDRPTLALDRAGHISPSETVLVARNISVTYGGVAAVDNVSLQLTAGKVLAVVGPNGAGKTSLIDALTGFTPVSAGTIELRGHDITGLRAFNRSRMGLGRTFQNLELFEDLSVRENILTGLDTQSRFTYAKDLVRPGRASLNNAANAAIAALGIEKDLDTIVANLPQGRRRMVAIARLIAREPIAIMLDEPAAGLSGSERRTACKLFRALADQLGAAVLLVEHNVDVVAEVSDEIIVLDFGRVIAAGPATAVLQDPIVKAAFLGQMSTQTHEHFPIEAT